MSRAAKRVAHMQETSISICIGVPTYNRPELLGRSLASIEAQIVPPDEIIIGDNSTDDRSLEIYKLWKANMPQLRYVKNQKNIGPAGNFLSLAEISRTTHFMWLADDDTLEPNHLSVVKDFLVDNPDLEYLGWGFQVRNYVTGSVERPARLPLISLNKSSFENACSYFEQPISCYFYGLYDRSILIGSPLWKWHERKISFDWMDVAFITHNILNYKSHFLPDNLVTYGVDEAVRPRKVADGQSGSAYAPMPWLWHGIMLILKCPKLTFLERLLILPKFIYAWKNTSSTANRQT